MGYNEPPVNQHPFLAGGGKMGELIRNYAWHESSLGTPDQWSPALKIAVGMMLSSPFPMHITWGKEYIQLYNDAYRPVLGSLKHPGALGFPIHASFPEIWDTIGPMFAGVMSGRAVRIRDFQLYLERNGFKEECYFDFAYSPIINELGVICGVLTNVLETTDRIVAFSQLEQAQAELRTTQLHTAQERDRLMQFFKESPAGICILEGEDFCFKMVNPLYQQLFPGRELVGRALVEAIPELSGDPVIDILNQVIRTGRTYRGVDVQIRTARELGGEIEDRYFDFTYQARLDRLGKIIGVLVFAIEVTDRKREELRKNDFIGIVSHELKTPLTSLQGIVQLSLSKLRKGSVDQVFLLEAMERAGGQVKRMADMINAFLNVSRLESGQIHIDRSELDFTRLVVQSMEELQLSSANHQLVMECRDVHMVSVDREKLISVVTNLMANAVKYSPNGGKVDLDCSVKNDELVFSVSDEGMGIAPHDLARIFERYYRVSDQQTRYISGFGIGLYLSAEIVRLHGGKIWAKSELGKGSTFYFSLPMKG